MSLRDALHRRSNGIGTQPTVLPKVSRNDLAALSREMGWTRGAEIGVWKGAFSAHLLHGNRDLHLLCVDPWLSYPAWLDTKNAMPVDQAERFMAKSYREACARLEPLNCTIVRKFSIDAAADVTDGSLDFIFVDGNHVYDAVMADLAAWVPKVKAGGAIASHDYRRFTNKPTIHVVDAVNAFTKDRAIDPWFVLAADRTPSFLWEAA